MYGILEEFAFSSYLIENKVNITIIGQIIWVLRLKKIKDHATQTKWNSAAVWPDKNRQMSKKVAKNGFTRKIKDSDTFTKIS